MYSVRLVPAFVSATGSLFAGAAMGVAVTLAGPTPVYLDADGDVSWESEVMACVGPAPSQEVLNSEATEQCLEKVMTRAVDLRDMANLQDALTRKVQEIPYFYALCHLAGHSAGIYAYNTLGDAAQLLRDNKSTACEYGYGHGIIDGLADASPPVEDFAAAVNVCDDYLEGILQPQAVGGNCADGTGHAAWWSTFDLDRAMDLCTLHRHPEGKSACVGGVVMEMYEPVGFLDSKNRYPYEEAPERLPAVCAAVAERGDPYLTTGCGRGSGYIFTQPSRAAADGVFGDTTTALRVAQLWLEDTKSCDLFDLEHLRSTCLDGVIAHMPISVLSAEPEALEFACAPLSGKHKKDCLALRLSLD